MKEEIRYGKYRFFSFMLLDLLCLYLANFIAFNFYLDIKSVRYKSADHIPVLFIMLGLDVVVTILFNTLHFVLRRKIRNELASNGIHVLISFLLLSAALFITKQGAEYSRVIVMLAYGIYLCFLTAGHLLWRKLLNNGFKKEGQSTALLMSNDAFVEEGVRELKGFNIKVKDILLLLNLHQLQGIEGIPVVGDEKEAAVILCWMGIDRFYIYGLEEQMVPFSLKKACQTMNIRIDIISFKYRVLNVKTVQDKDPKYGSLTFLEERRDIPFSIKRVYWITETEANLQRGFHAHKLNCQLLFCPYGRIDINLDDGEEKTTVVLDEPGKGLLLMPGLWREMVWKESGSVLCVLASEYYDEKEYIRNYDEFMALKKVAK